MTGLVWWGGECEAPVLGEGRPVRFIAVGVAATALQPLLEHALPAGERGAVAGQGEQAERYGAGEAVPDAGAGGAGDEERAWLAARYRAPAPAGWWLSDDYSYVWSPGWWLGAEPVTWRGEDAVLAWRNMSLAPGPGWLVEHDRFTAEVLASTLLAASGGSARAVVVEEWSNGTVRVAGPADPVRAEVWPYGFRLGPIIAVPPGMDRWGLPTVVRVPSDWERPAPLAWAGPLRYAVIRLPGGAGLAVFVVPSADAPGVDVYVRGFVWNASEMARLIALYSIAFSPLDEQASVGAHLMWNNYAVANVKAERQNHTEVLTVIGLAPRGTPRIEGPGGSLPVRGVTIVLETSLPWSPAYSIMWPQIVALWYPAVSLGLAFALGPEYAEEPAYALVYAARRIAANYVDQATHVWSWVAQPNTGDHVIPAYQYYPVGANGPALAALAIVTGVLGAPGAMVVSVPSEWRKGVWFSGPVVPTALTKDPDAPMVGSQRRARQIIEEVMTGAGIGRNNPFTLKMGGETVRFEERLPVLWSPDSMILEIDASIDGDSINELVPIVAGYWPNDKTYADWRERIIWVALLPPLAPPAAAVAGIFHNGGVAWPTVGGNMFYYQFPGTIEVWGPGWWLLDRLPSWLKQPWTERLADAPLLCWRRLDGEWRLNPGWRVEGVEPWRPVPGAMYPYPDGEGGTRMVYTKWHIKVGYAYRVHRNGTSRALGAMVVPVEPRVAAMILAASHARLVWFPPLTEEQRAAIEGADRWHLFIFPILTSIGKANLYLPPVFYAEAMTVLLDVVYGLDTVTPTGSLFHALGARWTLEYPSAPGPADALRRLFPGNDTVLDGAPIKMRPEAEWPEAPNITVLAGLGVYIEDVVGSTGFRNFRAEQFAEAHTYRTVPVLPDPGKHGPAYPEQPPRNWLALALQWWADTPWARG